MKFKNWIALLLSLVGLCAAPARAVTYANTPTTFSWIDPSSHTKIGYNTSPYKFNGSTGCQTTPPILDDTLSDVVPIGFTFNYAGKAFTNLRIMTNGRLQFNNNTTCGFGSPVQTLPYPNNTLNYTMRIYGNDLDPTNKVDSPSYNTPCLSIATCFISIATIGAAPNRSFVVTWNNVPEWTTGSNPQGAYNLQLILQENGEFIYQYGTFTAGPSAALGQVGWHVDSTDYDTPQIGFPTANTALKFFIPSPVAEYRMEQTSWSSAAGQVIDTSGNNRHGTRLGSAQTIASGRVCRAADIPSNSNTSQIDAIDTGINIPTTVGNAGTITFWYRANSSWTAASAKDAQLLDASVVNNQWFFVMRLSSGALRFVVVDSGGNIRSAQTGVNSVAANTWKHIAVSWNFNLLAASNSDHIRIYLDGSLLLESAFTTSNVLSSQIGTLYVGDNRSGFVGSSGTGRSADGAIDEFRIYNYEGGSALVLRDFSQGSAGCLNHYAVSHAGTGFSCQPTTVTITAHDGADGNITMPNNTTSITLSTATGKGDWTLISGYGTLNNGTADDGTATYLFNGEYQAVFSLSHSTAATVNINVSDGQFAEKEDPALVISACTTNRFNACELSAPRCVPSASSSTYARLFTKLAGTAFKLDLVKLKADGTLETTFNGSVTVDLLANSANSVALGSNNCPTSQTAVIPLGTATFASGYGPSAGVSVATTAFSAVSPNYSAYRDVRVRFTCSSGVCGSTQIACSTDNFAVRPTGFSVTSNMTNTGQSGTPKLTAGTNFNLTVTAAAGYDGTPLIENGSAGKVVGHDNTLSTALSVSSNTIPLPLGDATIATGIVSNSLLRYDDVGNFKIQQEGIKDSLFTNVDRLSGDCVGGTGALSYSNSLNSSGKYGCNIVNQSDTAYFGRFYPDHYTLTVVTDTVCPGFAYMGQLALGEAFQVTGYSLNNVVTSRLTSGYATLPGVKIIGDNNNGATVFDPLGVVPAIPVFPTSAPQALDWGAGSYGRNFTSDAAGYPVGSTLINVVGAGKLYLGDVIKFSGDSVAYTVGNNINGGGAISISPDLARTLPSAPTQITVWHTYPRVAPVGPYDAFSYNMVFTEADGSQISSINNQPVDPVIVTPGSPAVTSVLFGTTKLRYGRMRISNAYGSEALALPVAVAAQYWDGSKYVTNTLDNCTSLARANFTIGMHSGGVLSGMMNSANLPLIPPSISSGRGVLRLQKVPTPGSITRKGSFNIKSEIPWLPGLGRQTLGVYKSGPAIYIREVY